MNAEQRLLENGYDDVMYLTEFGYDDALIGVTDDGRAVYDYELMVEWLMGTQDWSYEEATECVDYNTLRALPYMGEDAPIVMNRLEDVCIMYTIIRTLPRNGRRAAKTLQKKRTGEKYTKSFPLGKKRLLLYCAAIRRGKGVFWLLENYRRKGYHNSGLHLAGPLELDNGRREKSKISRHIGQCKKQWLLSGKRSNNMESVESESETFLRLLKESGAIYDGEISRGELIESCRMPLR